MCNEEGDIEINMPGTSSSSFNFSQLNGSQINGNQTSRITQSQPATQANGAKMSENSQEMMDTSNLIEEIDNELQKDQQGVSEPDILRRLLLKLEQSKINEKSGRGCKVDSLAFKKFSQLMVSKAALLKDSKDQCLNMRDMAQNLKVFARNEFDNEYDIAQHDYNAFAMLGERLSHLLFKAPPLHYMRPCIPFTERLQVKERRDRARSQRTILQAKVVTGKTTEQAKEAAADRDESSVTKELDNVRRHFRAACKVAGDGTSIDYFRFVLHPTSFGETVENMFYVSFLVRDGHVRFDVDEESGGATIVRLGRQERERIDAADRSALDTTQIISRFDYALWQNLVDRLRIEKPMIVR